MYKRRVLYLGVEGGGYLTASYLLRLYFSKYNLGTSRIGVHLGSHFRNADSGSTLDPESAFLTRFPVISPVIRNIIYKFNYRTHHFRFVAE